MSAVQRLEFLDTIEAGLDCPAPAPVSRRRGGKAAKVIGGAMLTSAALMGMFGGVASAATASPATVSSCSTPDPIAQSQSKWCGFANYYFAYQYNYSPNGGIVRCYVFDVTIYHAACGGTVDAGRTEACTR